MAPPSGSTAPDGMEVSDTGGVYVVKENGLEFRHMPSSEPTPVDGAEFLSRFKYVFGKKLFVFKNSYELQLLNFSHC